MTTAHLMHAIRELQHELLYCDELDEEQIGSLKQLQIDIDEILTRQPEHSVASDLANCVRNAKREFAAKHPVVDAIFR